MEIIKIIIQKLFRYKKRQKNYDNHKTFDNSNSVTCGYPPGEVRSGGSIACCLGEVRSDGISVTCGYPPNIQ